MKLKHLTTNTFADHRPTGGSNQVCVNCASSY